MGNMVVHDGRWSIVECGPWCWKSTVLEVVLGGLWWSMVEKE